MTEPPHDPFADEERLRAAWNALVDERQWSTGDPTLSYRPESPTLPDFAGPESGGSGVQSGGESNDGRIDFELRERIGAGGMGVVWRARQPSLQREIAVKQVQSRKGPLAHWIFEQFVSEALVTGYLEHPNIVPIHGLGRDEGGRPCLAMKLVRGMSWSTVLHPRTPDAETRAANTDLEGHLRILISVCNAVDFAHAHAILHGDLKPANVMLGDYGEVMVMDWGLSAHLNRAPDTLRRTRDSASIQSPAGTPAYMPRELALAEAAHIGCWTDVYMLGAILLEILTGRPPHHADSVAASLRSSVRAREPDFGPDAAPELAAIGRRALAADWRDRYPTVQAFRQDLEEFLNHRESLALSARADALLNRLEVDASPRQSGGMYNEFADVVSRYRQSLELWEGNEDAGRGLREATLAYTRIALAHGDLGLAQAQLCQLSGQDPPLASLRDAVAKAQRVAARRERMSRLVRAGLIGVGLVALLALVYGGYMIRGENARAMDYKQKLNAERLELEHMIQGLRDEIDRLQADP